MLKNNFFFRNNCFIFPHLIVKKIFPGIIQICDNDNDRNNKKQSEKKILRRIGLVIEKM